MKSKMKQEDKKEDFIKPKKVFMLKLNKLELVHLRDLFSVVLPTDMKETVSQSLAASQGRQLVETKVWNKISSLCQEAEIPLNDEAPDFIVTVTAPPPLGVFEMMGEEESPSSNEGSGLDFDQENEEEEDDQ